MSASVKMTGGGGGVSASIFVKGLSETDTVFATKQVQNPEWVVPDGYTQLEYIESTGTQYINTGVSTTADTEVDITVTPVDNETGNVILGAVDNYSSTKQGLCIATYQKRWRIYTSASDCAWTDNICEALVKKTNIRVSGSNVVIDGASYALHTKVATYDGKNLGIFGYLDGYACSKTRLYSLTISRSSGVVRNFIPAKRNSDGVFGLYDLVNNVFYTNAGSGTFIAGKEVTQYIDSGVVKEGKWTEQVLSGQPLIPKMTSNTAPSGIASTSKMISGESEAFYAFDGNNSTYSYGGMGSLPWSTQYEFSNEVVIDSFSYRVSTASSGVDGGRATSHEVQISKNGEIWETIWSGQTSRGSGNPEIDTVILAEAKSTKYIKWVTTGDTNSTKASEVLFEFQVYGEALVGGHLISRIKDFGMWTVTATNGERTSTEDVLIDVITNYEIEIDLYKLWLYREGDECEEVTGGYKNYWFSSSWTKGNTAVHNHDNIFMQAYSTSTDGYSCGIATRNLIPLSGYTKLCILVDCDANGSNELFMVLHSPASDYRNTNRVGEYLHNKSVTYDVVEMDISSYESSYQISILAIRNEYCHLYKMWLE